MRLLCHRGWWWPTGGKNSLKSLSDAIGCGYGVETDIRDCDGTLVVSHDPPRKEQAISLVQLFRAYEASGRRPCLALNIKADGLQEAVSAQLSESHISNYFVFDMSVPDALGYARSKMPFAVRISEYETNERLLTDAAFVWLDAFHSDWYKVESVEKFLRLGKKVAIVSPELHGRDHLPLWRRLKSVSANDGLYLCTDFVNEALEEFDVTED